MRVYTDEPISLYGLVRDLFIASSITCALWALHRIGNGLMMTGQVAAYDQLVDAFTPEEREYLIHKVKREALRY